MASLSKSTGDCTSTTTIASFQCGPEHNDPPLESSLPAARSPEALAAEAALIY